MNRHSVPDADDLPALIRTSFDALPGPDEERLAAVGERLAQQPGTQKKTSRKGRHSWYWLWLLLAGGTVTAAAWWISEVVEREQTTVSRQSTTTTAAPPARGEPAGATDGKDNNVEGEKHESSKDRQPGPIIYQREGF